MKNKNERPQSHEDREAKKVLRRIQEKQTPQDVSTAVDKTSTLEDYGKKSVAKRA